MKKILGLLMMLFSLYSFAGIAIGEVEANEVVDVVDSIVLFNIYT